MLFEHRLAQRAILATAAALLFAVETRAQERVLTLDSARASALLRNPDVAAARATVASAAGRVQQAGAFPNPVFTFSREQTSGGGLSASQNIVAVDQRVEIGGQRSARRQAAELRQQAAAARLKAAEAGVSAQVATVYAAAVAADREVELATTAAEAFARARTVSEQRLASGDVSGYAVRRVRLEAARYGGLRAEALLQRRKHYVELAALLGQSADSLLVSRLVAPLALPVTSTPDSISSLVLRHQAALRAAEADARAAAADAKLARRERIPSPIASAGFKNEATTGSDNALRGFVAGISVPLPLWDRRAGAVAAAEAEARVSEAQHQALRDRSVRDALQAAEAVIRTDEQLEILRMQLGSEGNAALRAAETAYAEGEITLLEWLDAVRAYQEAHLSVSRLTAEAIAQRAALERATGTSFIR